MKWSADAVNGICSLRNRTETVRGHLVYDSLVERAIQNDVNGVTCLHASGFYRGTELRSIRSEIGSNEVAVSLLFAAPAANFASWVEAATGLLRGKGIVTLAPDGNGLSSNNDSGLHVKVSRHNNLPLYPGFYDGLKVEIFMMESRQINGVPAYQRVMEILRDRGAVWVSVTRALDGFGVARSIKKTGWLWKRNEVPLVVTAVGNAEALERAANEINMISEFDGYTTVQSVSWHAP